MNNQDSIFLNSLAEFKANVFHANKKEVASLKTPEAIYLLAVSLAYKDLQWRTIKKHNNNLKSENIKKISNLIQENVSSNETHIKLINNVEKIFFNDFGDIALDQCFGKAQKVVNMAFKYLYCINSSLVKIKYDDRDIPLDDRIFDFYYSYRKFKNYSLKDRIYSWSTIKQNQYEEIQKNLKQYIKEIDLNLNPIESEFIIWNYSTTKLVVDTFNSAKKSYDKINSNKSLIGSFDFIKNKMK